MFQFLLHYCVCLIMFIVYRNVRLKYSILKIHIIRYHADPTLEKRSDSDPTSKKTWSGFDPLTTTKTDSWSDSIEIRVNFFFINICAFKLKLDPDPTCHIKQIRIRPVSLKQIRFWAFSKSGSISESWQ